MHTKVFFCIFGSEVTDMTRTLSNTYYSNTPSSNSQIPRTELTFPLQIAFFVTLLQAFIERFKSLSQIQ